MPFPTKNSCLKLDFENKRTEWGQNVLNTEAKNS